MPSLDNWIEAPRNIINRLYEKYPDSNQWENDIQSYFSSKLSDSTVWNTIVSLNETPVKNLQNGQLVRFRAMIQDQLGPELYATSASVRNTITRFERKVTGKYQDELSLAAEEEIVDWSNIDSRHIYYCIPIPGETAWVKEAYKSAINETQFPYGNMKRSPESKKRSLDLEDCVENVNMDSTVVCKRVCAFDNNPSKSASTSDINKILNFPFPSTEMIGCLIKVYSNEDTFSINEIIEVVGILSFDSPSLVSSDDEREDFQPPSSIIPRLHALAVKHWSHNNPELPQKLVIGGTTLMQEVHNLRNELHGLLNQFLMGDSLAADYFLCHLISNVYCRKDMLALGKLSLNLSNIPVTEGSNNYTQMFHKLLDKLVTKCYYLPLSLHNMNTQRLIPKKDYGENRLLSGILQLSPHTHLILDETAMTTGQLNAEGVRNVTALSHLISWQKVDYDFGFHTVEFMTNIPVLILSERKSMLPSDVHLPLHTAGNKHPNVLELIRAMESNKELLKKMRNYLTVIKLQDYTLNEEMQQAVQHDFIESRQQGSPNPMSTDDFHLHLVLARLLSLTYGQTVLSHPIWQRVQAMERERKTRLQNRHPNVI